MAFQSLLVWIVIGAIAGLLANYVVKGSSLGVVGAVIVGIVGAFIGGWLFGVLGIAVGAGIVGEIITAFVGAVILLFLLRTLRRA